MVICKCCKQDNHGYTVIELLVVLLIVVILMALAVPVFYSSMQDSQKRECRTNMRAIANAQREYKLKDYPNHAFAGSLATLKTKVRVDVACPTGGTYTTDTTSMVHCSVGNHDAGYAGQPAGYMPGVNTQ